MSFFFSLIFVLHLHSTPFITLNRSRFLETSVMMRIFILMSLVCHSLAAVTGHELSAKSKYGDASPALTMLDDIIEREQGVTVNSSVKTSVIEGGLLLMGIHEVLENLELSHARKTKYTSYLNLVTSGLIPGLIAVSPDLTSPLDEFSVGTQFIKQ